MANSESNTQRQILTHAVLVGLTPLIPIPFVDDAVKEYFLRRMMRKLGEAHDVALSDEDVHALSDDPWAGCGGCGCVAKLLLMPIRRLIRKLLIFLEWKRAIDLVSSAYHRGYLVDYALERGWVAPAGLHTGLAVRSAVDAVIAEVGVKPVERVVSGTFRTSKGVLKNAARTLAEALKGSKQRPTADDVSGAIEAVEPQEEKQLSGVVESLWRGMAGIPKEHYQQLRERLAARLAHAEPPRPALPPKPEPADEQ